MAGRNFWSQFWLWFTRSSSTSVAFDCPLEASDIEFERRGFVGNEVGVVYIVSNDYHSEENTALHDHGKDSKNMENFFSECEDNFYVASVRSATSKKFLATCEYLALDRSAERYQAYPECCDKIIIYFAGHGKNGYIIMEKDYSDPDLSSNSRSRRNKEVSERSKISIEDILSIFRKNETMKMSRVLLLDACCSAENINCEENELVACAASDSCSALSYPYTGGCWTKELCGMFDNEMQNCDIEELLNSVKNKMNETLYPCPDGSGAKYLFPSFRKGNLTKKIIFKKRSMHINSKLTTIATQIKNQGLFK